MDPTLLYGASFQTSGASSRFRGEAAMTRSFVQRTRAIVKYKELFSYDRQTRRYVTAMVVSPDSPSHFLLEQALLRCNRKITPRRPLPSAKALRARQLRMMFGLSRVSEANGGTSQESSIIRAPTKANMSTIFSMHRFLSFVIKPVLPLPIGALCPHRMYT